MNLPPLSIPDIPLPFAVPHMVHPLFVHFAIALPVVILLFELVNVLLKRRAVGVSSFLLLLLMVVVYAGAYLTGVTDGKEAAKVLSPEAKEVLNAHKQLGIYLVYGSLVVLLFKLISSVVNKLPARLVFLLILILFILMAFSEGKKGGELVYKYGANVQAVTHAAVPETSQTTDQKVEKTSAHEAAQKEEPKAKSETPAPSKTVEEVKHKAEKVTAEVKEATEEAIKSTKNAASKTVEKPTEIAEKAKEAIHDAAATVKEKAAEVTDKVRDSVKKAVKPDAETPVKKITPVETIPAG